MANLLFFIGLLLVCGFIAYQEFLYKKINKSYKEQIELMQKALNEQARYIHVQNKIIDDQSKTNAYLINENNRISKENLNLKKDINNYIKKS